MMLRCNVQWTYISMAVINHGANLLPIPEPTWALVNPPILTSTSGTSGFRRKWNVFQPPSKCTNMYALASRRYTGAFSFEAYLTYCLEWLSCSCVNQRNAEHFCSSVARSWVWWGMIDSRSCHAMYHGTVSHSVCSLRGAYGSRQGKRMWIPNKQHAVGSALSPSSIHGDNGNTNPASHSNPFLTLFSSSFSLLWPWIATITYLGKVCKKSDTSLHEKNPHDWRMHPKYISSIMMTESAEPMTEYSAPDTIIPFLVMQMVMPFLVGG